MQKQNEAPIACVLNALSPSARAREQALLAEHVASVQETVEQEDGFAYRYPVDASLFARMAELVTLEHRCCPFLDFELRWDGAETAPWLIIRGGARVKPFVASTFHARPMSAP